MAKKRILIVEADERFRGMAADHLRRADFEVEEVESGEEALDRLMQGEHYDLFIVQLMAAKEHSWAFLKAVRTKLRYSETDLPILLVSDVSSDTLETKAFRQGANGFFVKGAFTLPAFVQEVKIQAGCVRSRYSDITRC